MKVACAASVLFASVLLAGSSLAPPSAAEAPPAFDSAWSRDALWDDGQAEVALYDAKRPQYGKSENYEAVFIVVKEDFDGERLVKADPPYEGRQLIPVLKLNAVHSYWTPNYPYHFLASVFVRRDNPTALVKLTVGSQEWCGNTFKLVKTSPRPELTVRSYFDPEGDATRPLDLRVGDLLEDQLPLALRSLAFAPGLEVRRRILPSLISNKLGRAPQLLDATIKVVGEETLATPAGRFSAWKVSVKFGEAQQTWWFEKAAPHTLLKMESSDGRAWLLKARTRKPYWQAPTYRPEM
ncbi:MAG: hypothetical protein ACRD4U_05105 [Candidatus Acidiferrales bacterium]